MTDGPRPDGDCGFCRYWVERGRAITGDAVEYRAWQDVAREHPGIDPERFTRGVVLVEADGTVTGEKRGRVSIKTPHPRRGVGRNE